MNLENLLAKLGENDEALEHPGETQVVILCSGEKYPIHSVEAKGREIVLVIERRKFL